MKMYTILTITLFSLLSAHLYAMITHSFTGLPSGNYQQSCRNITIKLEGEGLNLTRIITAECQDTQGRWEKTSIQVPALGGEDATLENENGQLKIIEQKSSYPNIYSLRPLEIPLQ